jgi:hypothetical protein
MKKLGRANPQRHQIKRIHGTRYQFPFIIGRNSETITHIKTALYASSEAYVANRVFICIEPPSHELTKRYGASSLPEV